MNNDKNNKNQQPATAPAPHPSEHLRSLINAMDSEELRSCVRDTTELLAAVLSVRTGNFTPGGEGEEEYALHSAICNFVESLRPLQQLVNHDGDYKMSITQGY